LAQSQVTYRLGDELIVGELQAKRRFEKLKKRPKATSDFWLVSLLDWRKGIAKLKQNEQKLLDRQGEVHLSSLQTEGSAEDADAAEAVEEAV
jgi:hypothetical protein